VKLSKLLDFTPLKGLDEGLSPEEMVCVCACIYIFIRYVCVCLSVCVNTCYLFQRGRRKGFH
jgi:hypothetical protein